MCSAFLWAYVLVEAQEVVGVVGSLDAPKPVELLRAVGDSQPFDGLGLRRVVAVPRAGDGVRLDCGSVLPRPPDRPGVAIRVLPDGEAAQIEPRVTLVEGHRAVGDPRRRAVQLLEEGAAAPIRWVSLEVFDCAVDNLVGEFAQEVPFPVVTQAKRILRDDRLDLEVAHWPYLIGEDGNRPQGADRLLTLVDRPVEADGDHHD